MAQPRKLGHAVLRVRDLKRSEEFYTKVVGLKVNDRGGDRMVFMKTAQDVHHDLAILQIGEDAASPEETRVGLYHLAFELSTFAEVEEVYRSVEQYGGKIAGYGDHGDNKGLYIFDPDGIEIEMYAHAPQHKDTPLEKLLTEARGETAKV